jgi:hypothetical protein
MKVHVCVGSFAARSGEVMPVILGSAEVADEEILSFGGRVSVPIHTAGRATMAVLEDDCGWHNFARFTSGGVNVEPKDTVVVINDGRTH